MGGFGIFLVRYSRQDLLVDCTLTVGEIKDGSHVSSMSDWVGGGMRMIVPKEPGKR